MARQIICDTPGSLTLNDRSRVFKRPLFLATPDPRRIRGIAKQIARIRARTGKKRQTERQTRRYPSECSHDPDGLTYDPQLGFVPSSDEPVPGRGLQIAARNRTVYVESRG